MMLPNQINTQRFTAVGKGGYRASEVDVFIQKVFQNYNKLYNDNNTFRERLAAITPLIDEYNENKKAIANALIWAQTTSDKTVTDAKAEAAKIVDEANAQGDKIISDKKAEAEAVYAEKLSEAKSELEKAEKELERIKNETKALSEKYIAEVNAKANEIIEDANANASKIVADAYNDAKSAREKADAIIDGAKSELETIKTEAAKLKKEIDKAVSQTLKAVSVIEIKDIEAYKCNNEPEIQAKQIYKDEIEAFKIETAEETDVSDIIETDDNSTASGNFEVETVVDDVITQKSPVQSNESRNSDFISGSSNMEMPDVNAYITKIFESAGSEDSDFSSFSDGLNDILAQSLEESDISFEDLQKSIDKDVTTVE